MSRPRTPAGPEALLSRAILGATLATGIGMLWLGARLHRGEDDRSVATELGAATDVLASVFDRELLSLGSAPLSGSALAGLHSLAQRHDVERVSVVFPEDERSLAFDHEGPTECEFADPDAIAEGQIVGEDGLQLSRRLEGGARLVVEAGPRGAERRHVEWVGGQARLLVLFGALASVLGPLLARLLMRSSRAAVERARERLGPDGVGVADTLDALDALGEQLDRTLVEAEEARDEFAAERVLLEEAAAGADARIAAAEAAIEKAGDERAVFLSHLAHELRTPLHAVVSTSALLSETDLDAEQHALATQVTRGAGVLSSTVTDLVELTSLERGELRLESEPVDLDALIEDVTQLLAPVARDHRVELLVSVAKGTPARIMSDDARLRRLVLHLAEEAVRQSGGGTVELRIHGQLLVPDAMPRVDRLIFEVHEPPGPGRARRQERLSGELERIQRGEEGVRRGLGLGLPLCYRLARAFGGSLSVENADDGGCRLAAAIPVAPLQGRAARPLAAEGLRVLVLDEQERSGALLAELLEREGASVVTETSAYAGFESLARNGPFDLALLDARLAGRDALLGGIETLEMRGAGRPRVVLVHPILGRRIARTSTDEAVSGQLVKPVVPSTLREVLVAAFEPEVDPADADETDELEAPKLPEPPEREAPPLEGIRVLLVDDNETNRQLVQYLLGKRGYDVDVAVDGKEAVDAFAVGEYDVVLMDCQMPVMDGFESTRRIRKLEQGRARRTPILAMSAGAFGDDVKRCLDAGMDDHIAKPFQPREMLAWLDGWLERTLNRSDDEPETAPRRRTTAREAGLVVEPGPSDAEVVEAMPTEPEEAATVAGPAVAVEPVTVTAPRPALEGALDPGILAPLLDDEGGRALAEDLVRTFLDEGPGTIEGLASGLESGSFDDVARAAHKFVSTSGTVGAVRLAKLMRELQYASKAAAEDAGAAQRAAELTSQAGAEMDVAREALDRMFAD